MPTINGADGSERTLDNTGCQRLLQTGQSATPEETASGGQPDTGGGRDTGSPAAAALASASAVTGASGSNLGSSPKPSKTKHTKHSKSGRLSLAVALVLMAAGVAICAYPFFSDFFYSLVHRHTVSDYDTAVEQVSEEDRSSLIAEARAYNERLLERYGGRINPPEGAELEEYSRILSVSSDGMLGYVEIPGADILLPVYHGTSDDVLQAGAGHLAGSSFPIEGNGVHAMITGHSGLPSASLFTGLDQMETGDYFSVTILGQTLWYQVDQIKVVLPSEADALTIDSDANMCTLVTCTPYGVNTHRLLVRGVLTDAPPEGTVGKNSSAAAAGREDDGSEAGERPGAAAVEKYHLIVVVPVLAALFVALVIWRGSTPHRKSGKQELQQQQEKGRQRDT